MTDEPADPFEVAKEACEEEGHVVVGFAVSSDVMTMARGEWSRIKATPARGVLRWCGLPVRLDMALPPRTVLAEYDEP